MSINNNYFTISFNLISLDKELPFSIYVNSSVHKKNVRFVKIIKKGDVVTSENLKLLKKYLRIYILESERGEYLNSLVSSVEIEDVKKMEVVKDSTIKHLEDIFLSEKKFNTEVLKEGIKGCYESMNAMVGVISDYNINHLKALISDLSFHDFYTFDHSINVSMYSVIILKSLKPKSLHEELVDISLGGLLHDLGKIKIPTSVLNNVGKLSAEDFNLIKKHPGIGKLLFDEASEELLEVNTEVIGRVIEEHHENVDGTGYPKKLSGPQHHLYSKVCSIADFFDAITTKRSYSDAMNLEDALEVMQHTVGKKIDSDIFKVFVEKVSMSLLNGDKLKVLPDDFDTERSHESLPVKKLKPKSLGSDFLKKSG